VAFACQTLGVARSSYYHYRERKDRTVDVDRLALRAQAARYFNESRGSAGVPPTLLVDASGDGRAIAVVIVVTPIPFPTDGRSTATNAAGNLTDGFTVVIEQTDHRSFGGVQVLVVSAHGLILAGSHGTVLHLQVESALLLLTKNSGCLFRQSSMNQLLSWP